MFHGAPGQEGMHNSALEYLDQHWRRKYVNAILVGRLARADGPAEGVNSAPAMPSRLWLGQLPGSGAARPALAGTLAQDSYVRVFIPVRAPATDQTAPK